MQDKADLLVPKNLYNVVLYEWPSRHSVNVRVYFDVSASSFPEKSLARLHDSLLEMKNFSKHLR